MDMELPDLESLNEEERQLILSVLRRDEELRSGLQSRASQVKQEVQDLRMKSVLRNGDDLSKMCARCKTPFGFLFNTGDVCPVCRFRVCKDCRQTTLNSQGWMCSLCFKENQLLWLSNENLADGSGEEEEEEEVGEVTGSDTLSLPPLSTSDHPSSLNTSPPATLYAGRGHHTQRHQEGNKASRKPNGPISPSRHVEKNQATIGNSRARKDAGQSGFSTPVSPAGRQLSSSLGKEAVENGGTIGNRSRPNQKCVTTSTSLIKGQKNLCQTSKAMSKTANKTKPSDSPKNKKENTKNLAAPSQTASNLQRQSSGCSFTSSEPGDMAGEEVFASSGNAANVSSHNKKEEADSILGQSSGYVSTDLAETQTSRQARTPESPTPSKSAAVEPEVKAPQADMPESKDADLRPPKRQTFPTNSSLLPSAQRSPVPRQSSEVSETFSASSAKTASPGTKIRLLDLASNRALERDGSDSVRSWSGGSEDTLSLGLSCSGFAVTAHAAVSRQTDRTHEAERQRTASAADQSHQSDRDHVDGDDPAEEAGTMLPAQRSNSMGDLLRDDSPSVSQMPYKKRTFTGSVDQLDRDVDNDMDGAVSRYRKKGKPLSRSRFSLAASRESLASVYSSAGETNFGRIPVTGEITFGLDYDQKQSALRIHLKGCQDLAPVDTKHNRSDPYVKTYLLPDMTRSGKRKSKIKKRTLNPVYNETLSYTISAGELETRTLWVTVWHSDRFGRNDFLGEVNLPMDLELFDDVSPRTYSLQSRMVDDPSDTGLQYKGELILSLMYVTADKVLAAREEAPKKSKSRSKKSKMAAAAGPSQGEVHVLVKAAKHLMAVRSSGASDPFVKGYLLPERKRAGKQKTPVVKNSLNPMWNHILVFEGIDAAELEDRSLELTVWDHETLGTNEFLGGTRLNLGTGATKDGHQVEWMDGRGEESTAWKNMMDQPDTWVDAVLPLRASMSKATGKKK